VTRAIRFTVNGVERSLEVEPRKTLLAVLRDQLLLTGTKEGCSTGDCGACTVLLDGRCGACTVLLDGRPVASCLVLAVEADGHAITTIEGLARDGELHPVQRAFIETGGMQCGFCTPGVILSAVALLADNPDPSEAQIRRALAGNLCRCTGYTRIVESVQAAARAMRTTGRRRRPAGVGKR
jgi:aerobic carbon-monoxide dehydrogenase small subunit